MSVLFDMIAGSSTGSILTAALVCPAQEDKTKPAYFADTVVNFYKDKGPEIYRYTGMNKGLQIVVIIFSILIGGVLGFRLGKKIFSDPQIDDLHRLLRQHIKEQKKLYKERTGEDGERQGAAQNALMSKFQSSLINRYALHFDWIKDGDKIKEKIDTHNYWEIKEAQRMLQESEAKYKESKQKKWIIMVVGAIIAGILGYYVPIGIHALTQSQYDRKSYDEILDKMFGHYRIEDALTDEVMMVSYSWNDAEPRFYTKYASKDTPGVYNVTIALAAEASTATPYYF